MKDKLFKQMVRGHTAATMGALDIGEAVGERLDYRDERGDITPRTVGIAAMTAIAVTATGLIVAKITTKESTINLGP